MSYFKLSNASLSINFLNYLAKLLLNHLMYKRGHILMYFFFTLCTNFLIYYKKRAKYVVT